MAKKTTGAHTSDSRPTRRRYVRRDRRWSVALAHRKAISRHVVVRDAGVTVAGPPHAVEDYLDAQEIDRRLADPANRERVPWDELKARRGL